MERRQLLLLILLALFLRLGFVLATDSLSGKGFGRQDYTLYQRGGELILQGDLAFSDNLFMTRPPLYPLLIAILGADTRLVLAANILFGVAMIPLTHLLARLWGLPSRFALVAAGLAAIDPVSVKYSSTFYSEPMANLLLACAFIFLLKLGRADEARKAVLFGLAAGALIMLSALVRPSAHLLWIPMLLWVAYARRRRALGSLLAIVSVALPAILGTGLWKVHNAVVYDNSSFSTVGTWNMLYIRAASVLRHATGAEAESIYVELSRQVEASLGNQAADTTAFTRFIHLHEPSAQLEQAISAVAFDVFSRYPLYYLYTAPIGLYRILFKIENMPLWLGIGWNALLLAAAAYGLLGLIRSRRYARALFLLIPCAYFILGSTLVMNVLDTRGRTMITPLLAIMAAYGIMRWLNRRRAASASPSPPADS